MTDTEQKEINVLPDPEILIPVFNAFERTVDCLESVRHTAGQAQVTVIDDASDDARVWSWLRDWEASSRFHTLLRHERNLGFVATANRGLSASRSDVVMLNSDTVVTSGWLDALGRCLASDPNIATATPWSNNGEIVSIPEFCKANPPPDDPEAVAAAARHSKSPGYPDLPTAVGFCMAISRAAIRRIGLFDAATFGRGYGEENDFSLRAATAGMRNVLCDDAFVVHIGGQSFGPTGLKPDDAAMERLLGKHPAYLDRISAWIAADPLADRRAALLRALGSDGGRTG